MSAPEIIGSEISLKGITNQIGRCYFYSRDRNSAQEDALAYLDAEIRYYSAQLDEITDIDIHGLTAHIEKLKDIKNEADKGNFRSARQAFYRLGFKLIYHGDSLLASQELRANPRSVQILADSYYTRGRAFLNLGSSLASAN